MQTALHGKIKERKGEWLIGASTQKLTLPFNCSNTTQDKKTRKHAGAY